MRATVHKAQPTGSQTVPDLLIEATEPFPDIEDPKAARAQHERDATGAAAQRPRFRPAGWRAGRSAERWADALGMELIVREVES
jgi:hypothetical protein